MGMKRAMLCFWLSAAIAAGSARGCLADSLVCIEEICKTEDGSGEQVTGETGSSEQATGGAGIGGSEQTVGGTGDVEQTIVGTGDGEQAIGEEEMEAVHAENTGEDNAMPANHVEGMESTPAEENTAAEESASGEDDAAGDENAAGNESTSADESTAAVESAATKESGPFIPAERVNSSDVRALFGWGVDPEIDAEVDAVEEIYRLDAADDGLLQMAAESSGRTADAFASAAEAVREGGEVDEAVRAAVETAFETAPRRVRRGLPPDAAPDRQHGMPLDYDPARRGGDAMAYLSSFVLSKVRDGSGDFDETTDLLGSDSGSSNGVIRTNDDITYVFSYAAALGEHYLYNTIRGARMYLEYRVPFSSKEVAFHTAAMPWMKGDGEDGGPILIEEDGSQTLIGYRSLPERQEDGEAFCIPGAGTVNCVLTVKKLESGTKIQPEFRAWLDEGSGGEERVQGGGSGTRRLEHALSANTSRVDPVCRVSVGPFLYLGLEKSNKVTQVEQGAFGGVDLMALKDGAPVNLEGSLRVFYYVIRCGKKNGSIRGVDELNPKKRIHAAVRPAFGVNLNVPTGLGLYDLRTFSMRTEDGFVRGVFRKEAKKTPIEGITSLSYGEIPGTSVKVENGRISFDIMGCTNFRPGSIVSQGTISFVQREDPSDAKKQPIYWTSLKAEALYATPRFSGGDTERAFDTDSIHRIENQVDPSGNWDSHLLLTTEKGSQYPLTSSSMATDATIGCGMNFNAYISTTFHPDSEAAFEKSRDYFLLWDNRRVELRNGGASEITSSLDKRAVFRYITKADGTLWREGEMRTVDFTSASVYQTLRFWPDYDSALRFLAGVHPEGGSLNRYICGVVCEAHAAPEQKVGTQYYQRVGLLMKASSEPENIGRTAVFLQAVRTFSKELASSYSSADGRGADPARAEAYLLRSWNLKPMEYEETRWDENGVLLTKSLTELNTLHKGSTLYIRPYTLAVKEAYNDGGETKTADLSSSDQIEIRVAPAFAGGADVREASASLDIAALKDGAGQPISDAIRIKAVKADGSSLVLENGNSYSMGDFVAGAPGSFTCSGADLADIYDGAVVALKNGAAGRLDGTSGTEGAGVTVREPRQSTLQSWTFEKAGRGLYRIRNLGSGFYLHGDGNAVVLRRKASAEMTLKQLWSVRTNEDRSVTLVSSVGGRALSFVGGGAAKESAEVTTAPDDGKANQKWSVLVQEPSTSDPGVRLEFQGLDSAYPFPELIAELHLNKALISGTTEASQQTRIAGDAITESPTKENGHVASVSLAFTEIRANILRESVDLAEVRNGEELTYTITYTNCYDEDHALDLLDYLPGNGDLASPDLAPHREDPETEDELATSLAEGAALTLVPESLTSSASAGSKIRVWEKDGLIRAEGLLRSGETAVISYRVLVEGAEAGDVIRNSCIQRDAFGDVWSNRVETTVLPEPDYGIGMTLLTGGRGNRRYYAAGRLIFVLALFVLAAERRKKRTARPEK